MNILLVDDDYSCRIATAMLLEHLGFSVEAVASGQHALTLFHPARHQIVVTDEHMPGMSGNDLALQLKRKSPSTPVVMYSGSVELNLEGVDALIVKPASIMEFQNTLARFTDAGSASKVIETVVSSRE